jgi:hypothetical protein
MYLRTTRRKNTDGSTVEYHQLAENSWDANKGCAVAKVIYNFGPAEQIDRVALRRLAVRHCRKPRMEQLCPTCSPGYALCFQFFR